MIVKLQISSYPSVLTNVLGVQMNRLVETVHLSSHNICFDWEIRKKFGIVKLKISSYPSVLTNVLGAQKNRLVEKVLLSSHNIYVLVGK